MLSDFSYDLKEYSITLDMGDSMIPLKLTDLTIAQKWVTAI